MLRRRWITPSVIEPSFGIGRILYCLFEHSFYTREGDAQRTVFRFSPAVAPVKATVFPLLQKDDLNAKARSISKAIIAAGLSVTIDTTGMPHTIVQNSHCVHLECHSFPFDSDSIQQHFACNVH